MLLIINANYLSYPSVSYMCDWNLKKCSFIVLILSFNYSQPEGTYHATLNLGDTIAVAIQVRDATLDTEILSYEGIRIWIFEQYFMCNTFCNYDLCLHISTWKQIVSRSMDEKKILLYHKDKEMRLETSTSDNDNTHWQHTMIILTNKHRQETMTRDNDSRQ